MLSRFTGWLLPAGPRGGAVPTPGTPDCVQNRDAHAYSPAGGLSPFTLPAGPGGCESVGDGAKTHVHAYSPAGNLLACCACRQPLVGGPIGLIGDGPVAILLHEACRLHPAALAIDAKARAN